MRGKLLFKPNDDLDIKLTVREGTDNSDGANFVYTHVASGVDLLCGTSCPPGYPTAAQFLPGITPSMTNLTYNSPVDANSQVQDTDISADVQYRFNGLTLGSTTAYQHEKQNNVQDLFLVNSYFWNELTAGSGLPPFYNSTTQALAVTQTSEELKLVSSADQTFSYVIGLFYSDTKVDEVEIRTFFPGLDNAVISPDTKTSDLYGRSTWKLTDRTALVTGLRYNYDQISYSALQSAYQISFPPPNLAPANLVAADHENSSTPVGDISLQHNFAKSSMGYVTYAHGYAPSAYNTATGLTPEQPTFGVAKKETINDFEVGAKGTYLENRLTLNVALFDTLYKNYQVQIFDRANQYVTSINPPLILGNAGAAETRGLEFDAAFAATDYLRVGLNAAYIDAQFTDYNGAPCYYPTSVAGLGFDPPGCYQPPNASLVGCPAGGTVSGGVTVVACGPTVQNLKGDAMPNSPKYKFTFNAEQRVPLGGTELVFNGNYAWRSSAQMLADQDPYTIQGAFGILNLSVGVRDPAGKYSLTAFANNVFNKVYYTDLEDFFSGPWGGTATVMGQPARDAQRYFGLRFSSRF